MDAGQVAAICRNCGRAAAAPVPLRCPACRSPRFAAHPEIAHIGIAHIDCDAFYAAIEKRDDPSLTARPVVIGGGRRGVVAAACYVARRFGVRSAMAMYKALEACPHAVVLRPDMAKYRRVGREVRSLMREATPLVEPVSIDEAFLDLSAHALPAAAAVRLARRIEHEIGITVSVGLAANKFLAKIASDLDKPRGFAAIGPGEAPAFLAGKPVAIIPGVGAAMARRLRAEGVLTVADLRRWTEAEMTGRFGAIGRRLHAFARGRDDRPVQPVSETRSISAETTFEADRSGYGDLARALPPLARTVAARLDTAGLAAGAVVLKLKTADFRTQTRSHALAFATQRADRLLEEAEQLLRPEADGRAFRLVGLAAADLAPADAADPPELFASAC